jgi:hypothetical protein
LQNKKTPDWEGHEPDTSARLLDVLITATTGAAKVSRSDRILFVACEFWAAARNRSLHEQLQTGAIPQLREAEEAFTAIGLTHAAGCLRLGRLALSVDPPTPLEDVAENVENWLADVDEPVDLMIAEFAKKQATDRHTSD